MEGILLGMLTMAMLLWIAVYRLRSPRLHRQFGWVSPPRLRIASGVPVSTERAAVQAWQELAHLGTPIHCGGVGFNTTPDPVVGTITIVSIEDWAQYDHAGRSVANVNRVTGLAHYAVVELPNVGRDVVLHELLHALGIVDHVSVPGHVHTGSVRRMGASRAGIRQAFRSSVVV